MTTSRGGVAGQGHFEADEQDGQAQGVEHGGAHAVGEAAVQGEAEQAEVAERREQDGGQHRCAERHPADQGPPVPGGVGTLGEPAARRVSAGRSG